MLHRTREVHEKLFEERLGQSYRIPEKELSRMCEELSAQRNGERDEPNPTCHDKLIDDEVQCPSCKKTWEEEQERQDVDEWLWMYHTPWAFDMRDFKSVLESFYKAYIPYCYTCKTLMKKPGELHAPVPWVPCDDLLSC